MNGRTPVDVSNLTGEPPAKEPVPIQPIYVSGIAYAKIIDGMMNVGLFREQGDSGRPERTRHRRQAHLSGYGLDG